MRAVPLPKPKGKGTRQLSDSDDADDILAISQFEDSKKMTHGKTHGARRPGEDDDDFPDNDHDLFLLPLHLTRQGRKAGRQIRAFNYRRSRSANPRFKETQCASTISDPIHLHQLCSAISRIDSAICFAILSA
jgi:hypothetical protein